ncbi:MAG: hypothetical protein ABIO72_02975 [Patescibacteria group bacterium]
MATTSPYDGPSAEVPAQGTDTEPISFVRSIRPPGFVPTSLLGRLALRVVNRVRHVSSWLLPLMVATVGGVSAIVIYVLAHPLPNGDSRRFKLFPPWSDEVWFIAGSFLVGAVITLVLVGRLKKRTTP